MRDFVYFECQRVGWLHQSKCMLCTSRLKAYTNMVRDVSVLTAYVLCDSVLIAYTSV